MKTAEEWITDHIWTQENLERLVTMVQDDAAKAALTLAAGYLHQLSQLKGSQEILEASRAVFSIRDNLKLEQL